MSAAIEVLPRSVPRPAQQRGSDRPTCPVCADSMIAAEASAFLAEDSISYLWSCDTCGYGFVTKYEIHKSH
ncbi:hypothetical protein BJ122_1177 [Rhodopseudomonas faecalis]|uniref:Uncharacterized protein n=1 Tax=Rhodopseudomonas faecalis TaxID=99655 RepID=A0A318TAQ5_9BRAD|nr:hypothetical protein [Rhodopseudomonas faecalis]PYF01784.1 hypothetical protein BJ122_1177 [Rhodopseudomonas faecalis]